MSEQDDLIERLKLEAKFHAQEARTANATIAEIYQLCTGATGEPGNWHGAEPVRRHIESLEAQLQECRKDAARYRWLRNRRDSDIEVIGPEGDEPEQYLYDDALDLAIDAAMSQEKADHDQR